MKKIVLIFSLLISLTAMGQDSITVNEIISDYFPLPRVDKRIELLSIAFRLAGNREYNSEVFKVYTQDIHNYFDKFKEHPLISFASKLKRKRA